MRIAFLADIHANLEALLSMEHIIKDVDQVICLGDFVGYYCQVNEVIDFVRGIKAICVMGNHDYFVLNGCSSNMSPHVKFGIDYARKVITRKNYRWLEGLPLTWTGIIDNYSLLLVHGSPFDPLNDYLYKDSSNLMLLDQLDYDLIAFGQTHRKYLREDTRPLLVNPGSVGQSRDIQAKACAMVFDTQNAVFQKINTSYNFEKVINQAKENGAGDWVTKHII